MRAADDREAGGAVRPVEHAHRPNDEVDPLRRIDAAEDADDERVGTARAPAAHAGVDRPGPEALEIDAVVHDVDT